MTYTSLFSPLARNAFLKKGIKKQLPREWAINHQITENNNLINTYETVSKLWGKSNPELNKKADIFYRGLIDNTKKKVEELEQKKSKAHALDKWSDAIKMINRNKVKAQWQLELWRDPKKLYRDLFDQIEFEKKMKTKIKAEAPEMLKITEEHLKKNMGKNAAEEWMRDYREQFSPYAKLGSK